LYHSLQGELYNNMKKYIQEDSNECKQISNDES